jgi:hypothetical protein
MSYIASMNKKIFEGDYVEKEIMKILTRNVGNYKNQFQIYTEISDIMNIRNPTDHEDLKMKLMIVLRSLPSIYDDVSVKVENGVLRASFSPDDTYDNTYENIDIVNQPNNMPTEISIIRFIVDQRLKDYYLQKDYLGNTIFHYLVRDNDIIRLEQISDIKGLSIFDENNDGLTPLDYISDIKTTRFFIKDLVKVNIRNKSELNDVKTDLKVLTIRYNNLTNNIDTFMYFFYISIIFYVTYQVKSYLFY